MKTVYVAGSFYKSNDSLINDFRTKLLGNDDLLLNKNENAFINLHGETAKYIGPFFYYPEEEKIFKEKGLSEQETVVELERMMVENCDVFIVYFGSKSSPGSVAEMIRAASLGKDIEVYYFENENNRKYKTEYWFPILMARDICKLSNTKFIMSPVSCANEFMELLKSNV